MASGLRWPAVLAMMLALGYGACLGSLRPDPMAEAITIAPRAVLPLPVRQNRSYWLLRGESGWLSAHEVRYGGASGEPALFIVRAIRFQDEETASQAFARLTPAYLFRFFRERMQAEPQPAAYPLPLPGDEVVVVEYAARVAGAAGVAVDRGQITVIRSGTVVLVIESHGIGPEQLVPAVVALVQATAEAIGTGP